MTRTAVERVVRGVADELVIQRIAGGRGRRAIQHYIFHMRAIARAIGQRDVDPRVHRVDALIGEFSHHITGVVDKIGVVARAARHGVRTRRAVENVVIHVAGECVIERIAGGVGCRYAGQRQVLKVIAKRERHRGLHGVRAFRSILGNGVALVIHNISIVARATQQRVGVCAAIEYVVAGVANDAIGSGIAGAVDRGGAGQHQVFHLGRQRVCHAGFHRVEPAARQFVDRITNVINNIGVIPRAASHGVRACATVQRVAACITRQGVVTSPTEYQAGR